MSLNKHEKEYQVENYCHFLLSQGSYTLLHNLFLKCIQNKSDPFQLSHAVFPKKALSIIFWGNICVEQQKMMKPRTARNYCDNQETRLPEPED